mgnify:CR=1 FL=1
MNCEEDECASTPAPICLNNKTLRVYEGQGSCHPTEDRCVYKYADKICGVLCKEGRCFDKSDACEQSTCTKPPPARCVNGGTLRTYRGKGTCKEKLCHYPSTDKRCSFGCKGGSCLSDPCQGISCQKPPPPKCLNSTTLRIYHNPGRCKNKVCSYPHTEQRCPRGCANNKCKVGDGFTALHPFRLLDTRGSKALAAKSSRCFQVTGKGGVPSTSRAVYINLVAVSQSAPGFLTAYPKGIQVPSVSSLNYIKDESIANGTIVKVGSGGQICVYTLAPTHIVVDMVGYFGANSDYFPVSAFRRLDTRSGALPKAGATQCYQVTGQKGIPKTAKAIFVNLVAVAPTAPGHLILYAKGIKRPTSSNLNHPAQQTIANGAIVKVDNSGQLCIYNSAPTHIILDVMGYFGASSSLNPTVPLRLVDSRKGTLLGAGQRRCHRAAGANGVLATAKALAVNLVAVGPTDAGFLHVYPDGHTQQNVSTLNHPKAITRANNSLVQVGKSGRICVYALKATHYIIDVVGYWTQTKTGNPCGGILCKNPPPTTCVGGKTLVSYTSPGTCQNGVCIYKANQKLCSWVCSGAKCVPKPPPPPVKTTYHPVTAWQSSSQPVRSGSYMNIMALRYITIHYNGGNLDLDGKDNIYQDSDFAQILRNIQSDYVRNRKYSIGYNSAVAPDGDEWELRGLRYRSAANGCSRVNIPAYTIFVPVRSVSSSPTSAQIKGVQKVIARIRAAALAAGNKHKLVVNGHRDVRPKCSDGGGTACPGQPLYNLIKNGTFK